MLGRQDRVEGLRAVPLLRYLDQQRLGALSTMVGERHYGSGQVVRDEGEPALMLPLLISGSVVAVRSTLDGRELRLAAFAGPCALDKTALLDGGRHTATFRAHGLCTVWSLPRAQFLELVEDVAGLRQHVMAHLAASVREQQERLLEATYSSGRQRVAAWLVRSLPQRGTSFTLPGGSQEGLGEVLGISRVTVNRALRSLERDGLISLSRQRVVVRAPELLARLT